MELKDQELVARVCAGDRSAFGILVERYQKKVYRLARDLSANPEDARDLAQEAFLKAFRNIGRFRKQAGFGTWLFRITVNVCMDYWRKQKTHGFSSAGGGKAAEGPGGIVARLPDTTPASNPHAQAEASQLRHAVAGALAELSPTQRSIFILRHYHEMGIREIASVLGRAEGTIKVHLFRAVASLRKKLAPYRC